MRNLSPQLSNHFASEVTTLATCWKITRQDGITLGFTDHDRKLVVGDLTYDSIAGFTPTNVESTSSMAVDNLDLAGQLYHTKITEVDLLAGLYDLAEVEVFVVNHQKPNAGNLIQKRGFLGEVTLSKNLFHAEIRGLTQVLSHTMCETYLPHCRANLGDARCKFNVKQEVFTVRAAVTSINDLQSFKAESLSQPEGWFTYGYIIWQSGANKDLKIEVKKFINCVVTIALPLPYEIKVGDAFAIIAGCDKASGTCINKFNNIINFRGEPDLPGMDHLLTTAGTMRR